MQYKNNEILSTEAYTVGENPNITLDISPTPNNIMVIMLLSVFLNIAYNEIIILIKIII